MKDKTDISKELLERAISSLPPSHDLINARHYIQKALSEINHASSRKAKKLEARKREEETVADRWKFEMNKGMVNPHTVKTSLNLIDKMIREEQDKLEQLKKPSEGNDNADMGTILD